MRCVTLILIKGFLRLEIAIEHELHHHVDRLVPCANTQEFDNITVVKPGDHGVSHGDVDNDEDDDGDNIDSLNDDYTKY